MKRNALVVRHAMHQQRRSSGVGGKGKSPAPQPFVCVIFQDVGPTTTHQYSIQTPSTLLISSLVLLLSTPSGWKVAMAIRSHLRMTSKFCKPQHVAPVSGRPSMSLLFVRTTILILCAFEAVYKSEKLNIGRVSKTMFITSIRCRVAPCSP